MNEIGSALIISDDVFKSIDKYESRLGDIERRIEGIGATLSRGLALPSVDGTNLIKSLDKAMDEAVSSAKEKMKGLGETPIEIKANITEVANTVGTSKNNAPTVNVGIKVDEESLSEQAQEISNQINNILDNVGNSVELNIADLKKLISEINDVLDGRKKDGEGEDAEPIRLSLEAQQQLVNTRKKLQDMLKAQQMSEEELIALQEKADEKRFKTYQKIQEATRKIAEEQEKMDKKQREQHRSTYAGSLNYSDMATTLLDRKNAIGYLEKARLSLDTADSDYAQKLERINAAIKKHKEVLYQAAEELHKFGNATKSTSLYLERWAARAMAIFSINTIKQFAKDLIHVRGEFELTQRSLSAMLQDRFAAQDVLGKVQELAVKSPFQLTELNDYVKRLSAYRVETGKLYDTAKMLADVSAGLGVSMDRIVLAYGQVKAAEFLKGTEVRQFTEAGINIYGELQSYFQEVKGETYSIAQIVDMISDKMVRFADVEAIFQRMTSDGGIFFNMQEEQADTLIGKLSNLGDSYKLMLNEIGKDNEGILYASVSAVKYLTDNWEGVLNVIKALIALLVTLKLQSKAAGLGLASIFEKDITKGGNVLKGSLMYMEHYGKRVGLLFKNLDKTFITNLPLAALSVLAGLIFEGVQRWTNYTKAVSEADAENAKLATSLEKLSQSYRHLAREAEGANAQQKAAFDSMKRGKINKLAKMLKDINYDIGIDVNTLGEEELDSTFAVLESKYQKMINTIREAKVAAASESAWAVVTDDLAENAKDYRESGDAFLATTNKMDESLKKLRENAQYMKSEGSLKLLKEADKKENESMIDYYQRLQGIIRDIGKYEQAAAPEDYLINIYPHLAQVPMVELQEDAKNFADDLDKVFGEIAKRGDMDVLKVTIDKVALGQTWGALEKEFAYKHYGINVAVNKENLKKEVDWVEDYLQKALSENEYKFNVKITPVPDFITEGDEAKKVRDAWQEVVERINRMEDVQILWGDSLAATFAGTDFGRLKKIGETTVTKKALLEAAKAQLELAKARAKALGIEDAANKAGKSTRDIYTERISLLKEMNSKYEELKKLKSDAEAAGDIEKQYAASLKEVGMGNILAEGFVPTKEETAKMIETVAGQIKDAGKRSQAFREAASLRINIDKDELSNDLKSVKDTVTLYLNSINLFEELQKSGLGEGDIKMMFGDIPVSFDEARKRIEEDYKATFGEIEKWGENVLDAYNEHMDNIAKKEEEHAVSTAKALISAYKKQLTEQVQLDQWYFEEKAKIEANENLKKAPQLQQQLLDNLQEQYQKKTAENTWKEFQESSLYIDMFNDLGSASYKVLDMMEQKLASLRSSLSNLSPENLKTIAEQIEKIREEKNARNPFRALISGMKELSRLRKEYEKMGGDEGLVQASENADYFRQMRDSANRQYLEKKQEYDLEVKTNGLKSKKAKALETEVSLLKSAVNFNEKEYKAAQNTLDAFVQINGQISNIEGNLGKTIGDFVSAIDQIGNAVVNLVSAISEGDDELQNMMNTVSSIGSTVAALAQKNYVGAITGALNSAAGIVTLMSDENDIVEMMEEQQRAIDRLERAYSRLYEQMEKSYDMAVLYSTKNFAADRLEEEIKGYEQLIRLERDRKNPDKDAIIGYENTIRDLKDKLEDLRQTAIQALGGIGEDEYASVAQGFVDAWVDAFQEGEDAVDALNGKFDEMIENIIKKQMMLRAAKKYLEPVFKAIDAMFEDESDGGQNATRKELDSVKELMNTQGTELNAFLKDFADVLGFTNRASSDLSKLQQGISSVSEETATAIESLLNSIRFFVATQQNDVAIIKNAVTAYVSNSDTMDSPLLQEMKTQTSIQTDIRNALMDVIKGGHTKGGRGIRVFMD